MPERKDRYEEAEQPEPGTEEFQLGIEGDPEERPEDWPEVDTEVDDDEGEVL